MNHHPSNGGEDSRKLYGANSIRCGFVIHFMYHVWAQLRRSSAKKGQPKNAMTGTE